MGRNSGGVNNYAKGSSKPIAVASNGKRLSSGEVERMKAGSSGLNSLTHRDMEKQINRAISRYEKVMGVRERNIRIADIDDAYGVTYIGSDGSHGIYLSRKYFDTSKRKFESEYKKNNYDTGFKNSTNRAAQHTVTHELAHATWTSSYTSPKHRAAGIEITSLYNKWKKDGSKKGYGTYGAKNKDEFWAEVVTKAIHGNSDKYTRKAIDIAKRFKL